jgi:hypothetical protein
MYKMSFYQIFNKFGLIFDLYKIAFAGGYQIISLSNLKALRKNADLNFPKS